MAIGLQFTKKFSFMVYDQDIGNKFFLLFNVKEHEKVSWLAVYCNRLSLLVLKLFAKMYKI